LAGKLNINGACGFEVLPLVGQDLSHRATGMLLAHQKGGFYHDGRLATLLDVVNHYDSCKNRQLTDGDKSDLAQYLLTL
jgi:hypothetical protein